jgi:hypothetical protein
LFCDLLLYQDNSIHNGFITFSIQEVIDIKIKKYLPSTINVEALTVKLENVHVKILCHHFSQLLECFFAYTFEKITPNSTIHIHSFVDNNLYYLTVSLQHHLFTEEEIYKINKFQFNLTNLNFIIDIFLIKLLTDFYQGKFLIEQDQNSTVIVKLALPVMEMDFY